MAYLDNFLEKRRDRLMKPQKGRRIMKGERRRHVVDEVMDVLKDWRFSHFENEASVRHGLRSAMCLDGNRWPLSDLEADLIVQEGLSLIGAKRPSWAEGQRDYAEPCHNCAWCGQGLPEEVTSGARQGRFCSSVCANSAIQKRSEEDRFHATRTGMAAYRVIRREQLPLRDCLQCGTGFRPFNYKKADQRFCTHECSQVYGRRIPERDCKTCGTSFRPASATGLYCSVACSVARPRETKGCRECGKPLSTGCVTAPFCSRACSYREEQGRRRIARLQRACEKVCAYCEETFVAKTPAATYCSPTCRASAHYHQKKKASNVIYLTTEVFDGWFRRAA
ncbi:hypothetical protein [Rhizobium sp. HT1-10]|uniref:hypothetical protein n=1 Tax=Rhizobium sp. HT1-10 TaxID=3111638 RepID=UPI003C198721